LIRYFDSSALVKRYVREEGSTRVRRLLRQGVAATARYSIVEMVSALARRARQGDLAPAEVERVARAIHADAARLTLVELTEPVASHAGDLLLAHPLRAADAVQLASCLVLRERASPDVRFMTYDTRLAAAAEAEGVRVD
jgi:predicted nucleic acid-binding protein